MASSERASAWHRAERVLAVRLDGLGDVVMTTPVLNALAAAGKHVTLLTSPAGAALAELLPFVDEIIAFDAPWSKVSQPQDLGWLERTLRERRLDAAIVFTACTQSALPSALTLYCAGVPLRAAYVVENPYHLLTDWLFERDRDDLRVGVVRHEVQRHIDLLEHLDIPCEERSLQLAVPYGARERVEQLLPARERSPLVVLHPGASAPSRRYRADRFGVVARRLVRELDAQVVLTGSIEEYDLINEVQQVAEVPLSRYVGVLSTAELTALIARADVLLTNNTGPANLAAAVGTPIVELYALTHPQHTPWQVESRVLNVDVPCRNCLKSVCPMGHHHCLTLVSPDAVFAACADLLERVPRAQREETNPLTTTPGVEAGLEALPLCSPSS